MKKKPTFVCHGCDQEFEGKRQFCTPRCKKLLECKAKGTTKFLKNVVAKQFQKMIRAEAGADQRRYVPAVVNGKVRQVERRVGQCVCVTCGTVHPWSGTNQLDTGHFVPSRRASILLEAENVAPQCKICNQYGHGQVGMFRLWMEVVHGVAVIERLHRLKTQSVSFSRDELVDKWFEYSERLKAAKERMEQYDLG